MEPKKQTILEDVNTPYLTLNSIPLVISNQNSIPTCFKSHGIKSEGFYWLFPKGIDLIVRKNQYPIRLSDYRISSLAGVALTSFSRALLYLNYLLIPAALFEPATEKV